MSKGRRLAHPEPAEFSIHAYKKRKRRIVFDEIRGFRPIDDYARATNSKPLPRQFSCGKLDAVEFARLRSAAMKIHGASCAVRLERQRHV
jgi:hypothetical protein